MSDGIDTTDSESGKPSASMTDHYVKMVKQAHAAEREAVEATERAKKLRSQIEAVKKVLLDTGFPLPDIEPKYTISPKRRGGGVKKGAPTWGSEILSIVEKHGYISYFKIRDILAAGTMGPQLAQSEKGFYGAMRRMEIAKKLVRHNGHAFTPKAFEKYKDEVERGVRLEIIAPPHRGTSISSELIKLLETQPIRMTVKEMQESLNLPNINSVYNAVKKLVDNEVICRDEKSGTYWHSKYHKQILEPKTAVLVAPPSREGELPLIQPSRSNG